MVNRIIMLTIIGILSVIASMPSYSRETVFEAYNFRNTQDSKPLLFYFLDNGSFSVSGGDVAIEYRICGEDHDYSCIYTANRNVTFAIPREGLEVDREWGFGGFGFRVTGLSKARGDTLFTITARTTTDLDKSLRNLGYELDKVVFLYSTNKGLLSFNRYFNVGNTDALIDSWILGEGLLIESLDRRIDSSVILTDKEYYLLRSGTYDLP